MDGIQFDTVAKTARHHAAHAREGPARYGRRRCCPRRGEAFRGAGDGEEEREKDPALCLCVCGCDNLPDQKQAEIEGQEDPPKQALLLHGTLPIRRQRLHRLCSGQ